MRITILGWNDKYQLRFELDRYEQMFKYDMDSVTVDELNSKAALMAEEVLLRFVSMRSQLLKIK
jgi:hypothetical protein|tara:strand:- start:190 stop:381 length:192 start_codon:yes stop_codon:yes gene_type:complete